jgi:hypothetical protein
MRGGNESSARDHGALREHHALGLARGARGVHHQRRIFLAGRRGQGAATGGRQEFGGVDLAHHRARRPGHAGGRLPQPFDLVGRDEDDFRVAVLEHVGSVAIGCASRLSGVTQ